MKKLFNKPDETTKIEEQTFIDAGHYRIIADPHEVGFANAAASLVSTPDEVVKPLTAFGQLVKRAKYALFMGKSEQANEWVKAIVIANNSLNKFAKFNKIDASKLAQIPIELHSHGFGSFFRELIDLKHFVEAAIEIGKDFEDKKVDNNNQEVEKDSKINTLSATSLEGESEQEAVDEEKVIEDEKEVNTKNFLSGFKKLKQLHPKSALAAAKIHSLVKIAGPAFLNSPFGPGTERILIGTSDSKKFKLAFKLAGDLINDGLKSKYQSESIGKAFALLHESFHLSQSWESKNENPLKAFFPSHLQENEILKEFLDKIDNFEKDKDFGSQAKWLSSNMGESYADLMAVSAIGNGQKENIINTSLAIRDWRDVLTTKLKSVKPTLAQKIFAKASMGVAKTQDPHETQNALTSFAAFCDYDENLLNKDVDKLKEAVKDSALVGLVVNCIKGLANAVNLDPDGLLNKDKKELSTEEMIKYNEQDLKKVILNNSITTLAAIIDNKKVKFDDFEKIEDVINFANDLESKSQVYIKNIFQKYNVNNWCITNTSINETISEKASENTGKLKM